MLHPQCGYLQTVPNITYLEADIPPLYFRWKLAGVFDVLPNLVEIGNTYSHLQKEGETVIAGLVLTCLDGQTPSQNGNNVDALLRGNEIISVRTLSRQCVTNSVKVCVVSFLTDVCMRASRC